MNLNVSGSSQLHYEGTEQRLHDSQHVGTGELEESMMDDSRSQDITHTEPEPCVRLVKLSSSILPTKRVVAVLDSYPEVQFGRDVPISDATPRIRLKEMEVSKLHATLFWDAKRREWAIVDMGSKHGTFISSDRSVDDESSPFPPRKNTVRLSPPRVASMPRPIRHLDSIIIGSTAFLCHIHPDRLPCTECTSRGESDIPLFHTSTSLNNSRHSGSRGSGEANAARAEFIANRTERPVEGKQAIAILKRNLLNQHDSSTPDRSLTTKSIMGPQYVDRSAKRRALHVTAYIESPGVATPPTREQSGPPLQSAVPSGEIWTRPPSPDSSSHAPISSTNIGHRLLLKQGWTPGTSLGEISIEAAEDGRGRLSLLEPLQIPANHDRVGLGMHVPSSQKQSEDGLAGFAEHRVNDWKEVSKKRRWDDVRSSGM